MTPQAIHDRERRRKAWVERIASTGAFTHDFLKDLTHNQLVSLVKCNKGIFENHKIEIKLGDKLLYLGANPQTCEVFAVEKTHVLIWFTNYLGNSIVKKLPRFVAKKVFANPKTKGQWKLLTSNNETHENNKI